MEATKTNEDTFKDHSDVVTAFAKMAEERGAVAILAGSMPPNEGAQGVCYLYGSRHAILILLLSLLERLSPEDLQFVIRTLTESDAFILHRLPAAEGMGN